VRVSIDEHKCQGHGRCYELAPELFTDDERGRGSVVSPDVPSASVDRAHAAIAACPERAVADIS